LIWLDQTVLYSNNLKPSYAVTVPVTYRKETDKMIFKPEDPAETQAGQAYFYQVDNLSPGTEYLIKIRVTIRNQDDPGFYVWPHLDSEATSVES